jgi:hypothetical protein
MTNFLPFILYLKMDSKIVPQEQKKRVNTPVFNS